ncbi:MAG: hypothetical protein KGM44_03985 [bacterium]|nr:hypothetical protein [bacterium]
MTIYDPTGVVETEPKPLAPRLRGLSGVRVGVLDNTKWNAGKLLRATVAELQREDRIGEVRYYKKESFSKVADPALLSRIAAENDAALTAIGD